MGWCRPGTQWVEIAATEAQGGLAIPVPHCSATLTFEEALFYELLRAVCLCARVVSQSNIQMAGELPLQLSTY